MSGTRRAAKPRALWAPDRQEVIWIDCNAQAGREMRDVHPFLVLSPRSFNERTSLVIGLPLTTAEYNADNPFAVAIGLATAERIFVAKDAEPGLVERLPQSNAGWPVSMAVAQKNLIRCARWHAGHGVVRGIGVLWATQVHKLPRS